MRLFLVPDNYYNHAFNDSKSFQAYRVESPDLDAHCYAYVRRNSRSNEIIRRAFQSKIDKREDDGNPAIPPMERFTLRLSSTPENAARRQFTIKKVSATGWVKSALGDLEDHLRILDEGEMSIEERKIRRERESWKESVTDR
jgi:hypothetical protein